jgi:hypothetical protein
MTPSASQYRASFDNYLFAPGHAKKIDAEARGDRK